MTELKTKLFLEFPLIFLYSSDPNYELWEEVWADDETVKYDGKSIILALPFLSTGEDDDEVDLIIYVSEEQNSATVIESIKDHSSIEKLGDYKLSLDSDLALNYEIHELFYIGYQDINLELYSNIKTATSAKELILIVFVSKV